MEERTKSSGSQNSGLNTWIWCIFIKVLCLLCILSECYGEKISYNISEDDDGKLTILYGDSLEIFCVAEHGSTSQDLEFIHRGKRLNALIVNDTTIKLFSEKHDIGAYTYTCTNKKIESSTTSRITVDTIPPFVTNFTCISLNLEQMKCSWVRPNNYVSVVTQKLSFLLNGKPKNICNVMVREGNMSSCTWYASRGRPLYRQQLDKYLFKMNSCNTLGCIDEDFTIDHFSVVKPNKPTDLEVIHSEAHSIILKWKIPNNMVDLLPGGIDHRVEYHVAEIDEASQFHKVDASDLPPKNRTYKFELTNLPYAHKEYEVRIYIRPKKAQGEGFWSDYAFKTFNTD